MAAEQRRRYADPAPARRPRRPLALLAVIDIAAACLVYATVDGFGAGIAAPAAALVVALAAALAMAVAGRPAEALAVPAARLPLAAAGLALAGEAAAWPPAHDANRTAPADRPEVPMLAADAAGRLLANVADFGAVIREHAASVIAGTEQAAVEFVEQLNAVDRGVKALTSFIVDAQASFRRIDSSGNDAADRNTELLGVLQATLAETRQSLDVIVEERQALAGVVQSARTLAEKSAMIAGIARTTKMLSINANIEASRAGGEGSGFGVIAKEIRELSVHTDKTTREMARLIEESLAGLDTFIAGSTRLEARIGAVAGIVDKMAQHLASVSEVYAQLLGYVGDITGRVDLHGREIEDALIRTFAKVQFQDIVRQQLEGIIGGLDEVRAVVALDPGPELAAGEREARRIDGLGRLIDRLRDGYVMQQQQEAHARATGAPLAAAGGGGPAIELF